MKSLYTTCVAALAVITIAACNAKGSDKQKNNIQQLPVFTVNLKDTLLQQAYVADIQAIQNIEIRAKVSGFLDKILIDEGQFVRKGQPLFQLNDAEYKVELYKAQAALNSAIAETKGAELEVNRVQTLVAKNVISKTELELAKAKLLAAEAKVNEARFKEKEANIKLSYTLIRSPFEGIIDRIPLKLGSLIAEGTLLTTLSDNKQVFAYFHVSENEYLQYVRNGKVTADDWKRDPIDLYLSDGSYYPNKGVFETMEGQIDDNTGAIALRARFNNPQRILKHGATGKIKLTTKVHNAVMIPQKSTIEIQDKVFAFVVEKDGTVRMQNFEPMAKVAGYYIVQNGIKAGQQLVFEGIQNLRDGVRIQPLPVVLDSALMTD
jgi:membrane fusion protein (multidrug efflux system)